MAKVHISQNHTGQFTVDQPDTTWIVDPGVTIASDVDFAFSSAWESTRVIVKGKIQHTEDLGSAVALHDEESGITVAKSGSIFSTSNGVLLNDKGQFLINRGEIEGARGITAQDDGAIIENEGRIIGSETYAVRMTGEGAITNLDGALIRGVVGLDLDLSSSGANKIVNHGTIKGQDWAISCGDANDHIVNRGKLVGSISLGNGDNVFDTRGGTVTGVVVGGGGADTYVIDDAGIGIYDPAGNGSDYIRTTVSYVLAADNEIERLAAIGGNDVDLTGNDFAEILTGNGGGNWLRGRGGFDTLFGRKGDDRLTGGDGIDHFVLAKNGDDDVVTDFNPDMDEVHIGGFPSVGSYSELQAHMQEKGVDLVIRIGKDSITLRDTQLDDISMDDFFFL